MGGGSRRVQRRRLSTAWCHPGGRRRRLVIRPGGTGGRCASFLIDENVNEQVMHALRAVYPDHLFETVRGQGLGGQEDVALFEAARSGEFDAIITKDRHQLRVPRERAALRENSPHWVGFAQKPIAGLRGTAIETATVVAGLAFVLAHRATEPTAFRLKGVPPARSGQGRVWLASSGLPIRWPRTRSATAAGGACAAGAAPRALDGLPVQGDRLSAARL
ncbi:MAG: hypothetical protein LBC97_01725, partial [Bifidobacteriaceae bacterium]|nr:hypothetical protein [Bifidobacteriaceae bacterium]